MWVCVNTHAPILKSTFKTRSVVFQNENLGNIKITWKSKIKIFFLLEEREKINELNKSYLKRNSIMDASKRNSQKYQKHV